MDGLELLSQLGHVDPADPAVVDAALEGLARAAEQESRGGQRPRPRHRRQIIATAATVAVTSAAAYAGISALSSPAPVNPPRAQSTAGLGGPSHAPSPRVPTLAAVLTAFTASSGDILMVTKTLHGEYGIVGKTDIWVSPSLPAPGTTVTSKILNFSLAGSLQSDLALTYTEPAAQASAGCNEIFMRPKVALVPAAGLPGRLTVVNYSARFWVRAAVDVRAATVPSAAALRACLASGQWSVLRHTTVDGAKAIELVTPDGSERLWVSAATFLPVRLVFSGPDVDTITFTFRFLPPTPANESALAAPAIPSGFARESF
jgi:hypothetical protein